MHVGKENPVRALFKTRRKRGAVSAGRCGHEEPAPTPLMCGTDPRAWPDAPQAAGLHQGASGCSRTGDHQTDGRPSWWRVLPFPRPYHYKTSPLRPPLVTAHLVCSSSGLICAHFLAARSATTGTHTTCTPTPTPTAVQPPQLLTCAAPRCLGSTSWQRLPRTRPLGHSLLPRGIPPARSSLPPHQLALLCPPYPHRPPAPS